MVQTGAAVVVHLAGRDFLMIVHTAAVIFLLAALSASLGAELGPGLSGKWDIRLLRNGLCCSKRSLAQARVASNADSG
eukprot:5209584-Pyramimonas_sp.AAC.1